MKFSSLSLSSSILSTSTYSGTTKPKLAFLYQGHIYLIHPYIYPNNLHQSVITKLQVINKAKISSKTIKLFFLTATTNLPP